MVFWRKLMWTWNWFPKLPSFVVKWPFVLRDLYVGSTQVEQAQYRPNFGAAS